MNSSNEKSNSLDNDKSISMDTDNDSKKEKDKNSSTNEEHPTHNRESSTLSTVSFSSSITGGNDQTGDENDSEKVYYFIVFFQIDRKSVV